MPPSDVAIPSEQFFYGDPEENAQIKPTPTFINRVQYPTLGCPALLGPADRLQVVLSLDIESDPAAVRIELIDRHGQRPDPIVAQPAAPPERLADRPDGRRVLWRIWTQVGNAPFKLFDLRVVLDGGIEVQKNAIRRFSDITGKEAVIFCGDSQYHIDNRECLERFVKRVNEMDVAWIAMIGDICDNGVKGPKNILRLAAGAASEPVTDYYLKEYSQAHDLLSGLRHPVILVPGNHDAMTSYPTYDDGNASDVFVGPDPENRNVVEYDGLHGYRRTFGPLYYHFDWARTRYLCVNSFELTRHQRLGYHAIVANWGGWMRDRQADWLAENLRQARSEGLRTVVLMHHDPRGGSMGIRLGQYHKLRPYQFDRRWPLLKAYLSYFLKHGRNGWQQEWMAPADGDLAGHPVRHTLKAILDNRVWAVIMGHDNENWIDSYFDGGDLFKTSPSTVRYATREDVADEAAIDDAKDYLEAAEYDELLSLIEAKGDEEGEAVLSAALHEIESQQAQADVVFGANPAEEWGLEVQSAIHFIHVDDVGAYKYSKESHFESYGFVHAVLEGGAPSELQSHRVTGPTKPKVILAVD